MRKVSIGHRQFEFLLFPYIAGVPAKDVNEFETQLRLMKKLKDPELTDEVPLTEEEKEAAAKARIGTYPSRKLKEIGATFMLDEDEWKMALARMKDARTRVTGIAAEDLQEVIDLLKNAPKVEVKPEE